MVKLHNDYAAMHSHTFSMKLDEFMAGVGPKARSRLAPHLEDMLILRDRGYTLAQIRDFVCGNGVDTSASNLAAYLRRNSVRLRPQPQPAAVVAASSAPPSDGQRPLPSPAAPIAGATPKDPLEREFKYGAHDPRRIDEILRNPPDMEALRKRGLEMAREHAKKKT